MTVMIIDMDRKRIFVLFLLVTSLILLRQIDLLSISNALLALLAASVLVVFTADGLFEKCYILYKTLPRDLKTAKIFVIFRLKVLRFQRNRSNVPEEFNRQVRRRPNGVCFVDGHRQWTYKEVNEFSNRVANVFQQAGLVKGDVVALYMESIPEFICIWLGLAKVGVITALINHNLRLQSFAHTVTTAKAKALIFGSNLADAVVEIVNSLPSDLAYYYYNSDEGSCQLPFANSLVNAMAKCSAGLPTPTKLLPYDRLLYISTSGTTGLPKAAIITHSRYYLAAAVANSLVRPQDICYGALPLYHTTGGILSAGQAVCFGVPVVIRKKFSASQFWTDCIQYKCTVTFYIGEICRYLLAQPQKPEDRAHSIRLMLGGGLRAEIWESFVNRYGIGQVVEFYASTEGNSNIVNIDGQVGAVGFIPTIFSSLFPCSLIKVDERTGVPLRNSQGLCIQCKKGEVGEFVGKIIDNRPERRFDGYVNQEATSKKIYKDVFHKGDRVFATGDIMVMDRLGYLYFKDRTGDTFRWKGENVSTTEVESVISGHIGLNDCSVYGVEVPNCEGRAGMAAFVDPNRCVDLDKLHSVLVRQLPSYARPLFIRITDSLPITGTFKLKKFELQKDGFNPDRCGNDYLYYVNGHKYSIMTLQTYNDICSGQIRY